MYIYIFGSTCRGEIDKYSDVDMLAIVKSYNFKFNPNIYSVYSEKRINELWIEGNPFAWHLYSEARFVYSNENIDYLRNLGAPSKYHNGLEDCTKFLNIFLKAKNSLLENEDSIIFDFSTIFLSIRNIATCYSLHNNEMNFSRSSALKVNKFTLNINELNYRTLEKSRILCTRGFGEYLSSQEISKVKNDFNEIEMWMKQLIKDIEVNKI